MHRSLSTRPFNPPQPVEFFKLKPVYIDGGKEGKDIAKLLKSEMKVHEKEVLKIAEANKIEYQRNRELTDIETCLKDVNNTLQKMNKSMSASLGFGSQIPVIGNYNGMPGNQFITVTKNSSQPSQSFNVQVQQLASQDQSRGLALIPTTTTALNWSGNLTFNTLSLTTPQVIVTIDPTMALQDVNWAINAISAQTGVISSIIPSQGQFKLNFMEVETSIPLSFINNVTGCGDALPNLSTSKALSAVLDPTVALNWAGTITLAGTAAVTVNITDDLNDIMNNINAVTSQTNIVASIENDNDGNHLVYRNQVNGNSITVTNAVTGPVQQLPLTTTVNVSNLSAQFTYMGEPNTSSTNIFSTNGVQIQFSQMTTQPISVTFNNNIDDTVAVIKNWQKSQNELLYVINRYTSPEQTNLDEEIQPLLNRSLFCTEVKNFIKQQLLAPIPGLSNSPYKVLGSIGFYMAEDNTKLELNVEKLQTALTSDFTNVLQLFNFSIQASNTSIALFSHPQNIDPSQLGATINLTVSSDTNGVLSAIWTNITNLGISAPIPVPSNFIVVNDGAINILDMQTGLFQGYVATTTSLLQPNQSVSTNFSNISQGIKSRYEQSINRWLRVHSDPLQTGPLDREKKAISAQIESNKVKESKKVHENNVDLRKKEQDLIKINQAYKRREEGLKLAQGLSKGWK